MEQKQATVNGKNLPMSTKHAIEISNFIKTKSLEKARKQLTEVLNKKRAIPFKKFNKNVGHKSGKIMAGRYPIKATKEFINLLNSLEANAQDKGLNTENLVLKTIISNKASRPLRQGRKRGVLSKRTHVTIIAEEGNLKISNIKEQKNKTEKNKTNIQTEKKQPESKPKSESQSKEEKQ